MADPARCAHVPSRSVVVDVYGTLYVLMHCDLCDHDVEIKLDTDRKVLEQWIFLNEAEPPWSCT